MLIRDEMLHVFKRENDVILDKMYTWGENLVFYPKKSTRAGKEDLPINLSLGKRDFTRAWCAHSRHI